MPFTKLSVSDAIGLVTLRLGRVEQFIIDFENGEFANTGNGSNGELSSSIPENAKIVDNSVFANIISRVDSLEKNNHSNSAQVLDEIKIIQASMMKTQYVVGLLTDQMNETKTILSAMQQHLQDLQEVQQNQQQQLDATSFQSGYLLHEQPATTASCAESVSSFQEDEEPASVCVPSVRVSLNEEE